MRRLGRYTLRYRIAQGGMASVYLAQLAGSSGFDKWVALKTIHPHIATSNRFVNMFLDEAQLASRLEHPNLCSVFDFGEERGTWFIAMEYLHGETFGVVARTGWSSQQPPPYAIIARILADAARGLHAAHELRLPSGEHAGVVHRDVSPENIFVTYDGPTKVVDFGVARWKSQSQDRTVAGELKGKIAYMCPEQLREEPVDRRADIWSLGVVLWETTVGRRLFRRKTDAGTVYAVLNDRVPRPVRFRPDYPPALAAIVARALERDRDQRYQTALEFARALEQWLASTGQPAGTGEVGEYMHSLFTEQIAFRERLLRTQHLDAPVEEVSQMWHSAPIDPAEVESAPDEIPAARPSTPADMSEEATLLSPNRYVTVVPDSLATVVGTRPPPAPSDPPILLTSTRQPGAYQLGPATSPPLSSGAHRAVNTSKLPAWRRRGGPSLVAGILLSLVSAAVIVYFFASQGPAVDVVPPRVPVARRDPPPVVSVSTPPTVTPTVTPPIATPTIATPTVTPPTAPVAPRPALAPVVRPVAAIRASTRPAPHAAVDGGAAESTAAAPPGYLTFIATPDAEVFEGGRSLGRTPLTDRAIPSGRHTFRFVPGGDLASQTVQVNVQPGNSSVVEMRWDPANP